MNKFVFFFNFHYLLQNNKIRDRFLVQWAKISWTIVNLSSSQDFFPYKEFWCFSNVNGPTDRNQKPNSVLKTSGGRIDGVRTTRVDRPPFRCEIHASHQSHAACDARFVWIVIQCFCRLDVFFPLGENNQIFVCFLFCPLLTSIDIKMENKIKTLYL